MTTHYGVWSDWPGRDGKEWWQSNGELFHTPDLGIAKAQAIVTNAIWKRGPAYGTRKDERWEARVIGEDGLPTEKVITTTVDLLADAEKVLRVLPSVEEAYVSVEFILHRAGNKLTPCQFAEYVLGVKAAGEMITDALATRRGVSVIGSIGGTHAIDMMKEGP